MAMNQTLLFAQELHHGNRTPIDGLDILVPTTSNQLVRSDEYGRDGDY